MVNSVTLHRESQNKYLRHTVVNIGGVDVLAQGYP